jgi:hypothetical protein
MVAAVSTAAGQTSDHRKGFFTAVGIGYGTTDFTCSACASDREGGVATYLDLGAGLSQSVILGGEIAAWWRNTDGDNLWISNFMFFAQVYPASHTGFFLKGGLGWSHAEGIFAVQAGPNFRAFDGGGYTLAAGYDFSSGGDFSFSATLGTFGGIYSSSGIVTDPKTNVIQLLVGVTLF